MSSMLKKAGAGAFKPKAPIARRRPAPNGAAQNAAQPQTAEAQSNAAPSQEPTPESSREVATPSTTTESRPEQPTPPTSTDATAATDVAQTASRLPASTNTRTTTSKSPEARRVAPAAHVSPVATPNPSSDRPQNASASSVPSRPPSTRSEESTKPVDKVNESTAASSVSETPISTTSEFTTPNNTASTSRPKPTRPTATKPRPAAETTAPEAPPVPQVPPPSADGLVPSIENGEGPSTGVGTASTKSKKPAARKPRKRKTAAATGESDAEAGANTAGPVRKKRAPRKKGKTNGVDTGSQAGASEDAGNAAPNRRSRRKRKVAEHADESAQEAGGEDTDDSDEGTGTERPKKKRRERSVTPSDAETKQIDPITVTLAQLTKDLRQGRRWEHSGKLKKADLVRKREAMRQRLIRQGLIGEDDDLPNDSSEAGTPALEALAPVRAPTPPPPEPMAGGISIRVVDGQIVTNEESMQFDRHAEAERSRGNYATVEENEFSKRVNQMTYAARKPQKNNWSEEDTETFYRGLRMFGTDFNMISKMFNGGRTRRQIKLKFNREERANPVGVNNCLIGVKDVAMDLEAVGGAEGLEDSKAIEDELAALREEREAESKRLEEEIAAEAKRKREELMGKRKGDPVGREKGKGQQNGGDVEMGDASHDTSTAAKNKGRSTEEANPGAKYGVGTDPDVIDETDMPAASTRGRGGGRGRGRGGRRGRGAASVFASGFGT